MEQAQDENTGARHDPQSATDRARGDNNVANPWHELQEASMELSQAWLHLPWQLANGGNTDAVGSAINRMYRAQLDICQQWTGTSPSPAAERPEAYCMRCQARRPVDEAEEVTLKNGRPALRGTCGACGTRVFRIRARSESQ